MKEDSEDRLSRFLLRWYHYYTLIKDESHWYSNMILGLALPYSRRNKQTNMCTISHPLWAHCVSWTKILLMSILKTICTLSHWYTLILLIDCLTLVLSDPKRQYKTFPDLFPIPSNPIPLSCDIRLRRRFLLEKDHCLTLLHPHSLTDRGMC